MNNKQRTQLRAQELRQLKFDNGISDYDLYVFSFPHHNRLQVYLVKGNFCSVTNNGMCVLGIAMLIILIIVYPIGILIAAIGAILTLVYLSFIAPLVGKTLRWVWHKLNDQ